MEVYLQDYQNVPSQWFEWQVNITETGAACPDVAESFYPSSTSTYPVV
jgi:hypothetical protein